MKNCFERTKPPNCMLQLSYSISLRASLRVLILSHTLHLLKFNAFQWLSLVVLLQLDIQVLFNPPLDDYTPRTLLLMFGLLYYSIFNMFIDAVCTRSKIYLSFIQTKALFLRYCS